MAISINKPTVGGSTNTWGSELNTALDILVNGVNTAQAAADANTGGGGGTGGIPATTVTAKGDLLVATGSGNITRRGVGADGYTLIADSGQSDGVTWKLAPGTLIAKLRQTTAQTIPDDSANGINWNINDRSGFTGFVNGSSTWTAPLTGWYELTGGVSFVQNSAGVRACFWYVAGTTVPGSATVAQAAPGLATCLPARTTAVQLTAGQGVALYAYQANSGGTLATYVNAAAAQYQSSMTVTWLGA